MKYWSVLLNQEEEAQLREIGDWLQGEDYPQILTKIFHLTHRIYQIYARGERLVVVNKRGMFVEDLLLK